MEDGGGAVMGGGDGGSGGGSGGKKGKKKGKKKAARSKGKGPTLAPGSHTDAVMALACNRLERKLLASGSADCTVRV